MHASYAMLAVQGPVAREIVQAIADNPLPPRMTAARGHVFGRDVLICGTGYTGEDGVELLVDPEDAAALWDEIVRRGAVPAGLAARDTLRLEACFHLYGNDLSTDRNPIEAGLGWACKEDTGFIGADAVRAAREGGHRGEARAVQAHGLGHRAPGQPGRRRRRGDERHDVAVPGHRHRDGLPAAPTARRSGEEFEIDVRGKTAYRRRRVQAALRQGDRWLRPSTPRTCATTPSTTGRASTDDIATFGITWFAQDALGEVVFFDPPEVGSSVTAGEFYAEVESVKAVSDVIAPLSGEIVEVNTALADAPEAINEDPTGTAGW